MRSRSVAIIIAGVAIALCGSQAGPGVVQGITAMIGFVAVTYGIVIFGLTID